MIELFDSIQGEGSRLGEPSFFIRLAGCNLSCPWCDSKYANAGVSRCYTVEDLAEMAPVRKNIVITGGEPLLQMDALEDLLDALWERGKDRIEVETNGTLLDPRLRYLAKANISPKFGHINMDALRDYAQAWLYTSSVLEPEFKFVIGDLQDYCKAKQLAEELEMHFVSLMPRGTTPSEVIEGGRRIAEWMKDARFNVANCFLTTRLQILLWGNERGR